MTVSLIIVVVQLAVTCWALLREPAKDSRFEDDKLIYRS